RVARRAGRPDLAVAPHDASAREARLDRVGVGSVLVGLLDPQTESRVSAATHSAPCEEAGATVTPGAAGAYTRLTGAHPRPTQRHC
ncbi:MAG TPA: hypothetical protein VHV50_13560, partial [Actinomycetota bacterium]|nr:hypothetical protein [Actinomycetota bacterium]